MVPANQSFKLASRIREPHGREASDGLANPAAYASRLTSQMETLISPDGWCQAPVERFLVFVVLRLLFENAVNFQQNMVFVARYNFDLQARTRVSAVLAVDNSDGAGPVPADVLGHYQLNDHAIMQSRHRSIIGFVGAQSKSAVVLDCTASMNTVFARFQFHRARMDGTTRLELHATGDGIGWQPIGASRGHAQ